MSSFARPGETRFAWRRFSPGPLQPHTAPGKALKWFWQRAPQAGEPSEGPDHQATLNWRISNHSASMSTCGLLAAVGIPIVTTVDEQICSILQGTQSLEEQAI